ncbi:MAG: hypothetical protein AAF721_12525 [Myxococcota bacterium]
MKLAWTALLLLACGDSSADGGDVDGADTTAGTSTSGAMTTAQPTTSVPEDSGSTSVGPISTSGSGPVPDSSGDEVGSTTGPAPMGAPCGDLLWSWAWAGPMGENLTLVGDPGEELIERMADLSGNGRDYFNEGGDKPAFQVGYSWDDGEYSTRLPAIALHERAGGMQIFEQFMFQDESLDAGGGFYLAFAGMNSRDTGQREMWGTTEQDTVRLDQDDDRVNIVVGGQGFALTPAGSVPKGPLLLEIWRDDAGVFTVYVNGSDATEPGAASTNIFGLSGIGHDQTGTSGWDDVAFEYVVCDGLPDAATRDEARAILNARWAIF